MESKNDETDKNAIQSAYIEENKIINDETKISENNEISLENNSNKEVKHHRQELIIKEDKKRKIFIFIFIFSIVTICILLSIIAILNRFNTNVYKNVYIFGENISNYTSEEVINFLDEKSKIISSTKIDVYQGEKDIYDVKSEDIDFVIDTQKTSDNVMQFGRKDNIFVDNFKILKAFFTKKEIDVEYKYSNEKLDTMIKNIDLTIENRFVDDSYSLDEIKHILIIKKGITGNSIDYNKFKDDIIAILKSRNTNNYSLDVIIKKPKEIDINKLYTDVKRSPEDARIDNTTLPPQFINEKVGYDLDIQKLNNILNLDENKVEGKSIEFNLITLEPKIKLSEINYTLYNDKLAGYTTYFDSSQKSRGNNIEIALKYLNGSIIMPGQTFSFNDKVGEITQSKGYLPAATFKGGNIVNEIGGGVCQTSSTLYNVALMSNLEIIERHQHGLPVGYVPPSRDATIYVGVLDLKVKNNRKYPVKIVTVYSKAGNMNISMYGTKEKEEYEITLSSKVLNYIPFSTKYIADNNTKKDTSYIVSNGVNGYTSQSYITKKLNGTIVSSNLLTKDTYKPQQQVVNYGIKETNISIY
ncbi:MAG: VanW family protein [Clostridia bacterium]